MGKAEQVASGVEEPCPVPLTRSNLESQSRCPPEPGMAMRMSITPKCHRESGMKVWYDREEGHAILVCAACGAGVARLQLAHEAPS